LFAEVRNELTAGTALYCSSEMQNPRLTGRGFCNKKRGEENEKDEVELFDIIVPGIC